MLAVGKLSSLLMRNSWKVADEPLTPVDRTKLESMAMVRAWLEHAIARHLITSSPVAIPMVARHIGGFVSP